MNAPPAGWYPDPFAERWWDGGAWAPLTRDEGTAVAPTEVLARSTPPGWFLDPFAERWWDGISWTETARSRWEPRALIAPSAVVTPPESHLVPVVDGAALDRRRRAMLVGASVTVAIVIGVIAAILIGKGGDSKADVTTPPTSAAIPGPAPTLESTIPATLPPIVTVDPTASTFPPITINASTTSVWNTSLPSTTAPPPTAAPETTVAPTTPPATVAPTVPPGTVTVPRITVAPTSTVKPATGSGTAATASCQAPDSYANDGTPVSFAASNAIDGDASTAWRCAAPGTGETLTVDLGKSSKLKSVGLIAGYTKVDAVSGLDRFEENYRLKQVRWHFDDGTTVDQHLEDVRDMQTMKVKATTTKATMEVVDVYPPSFPVGNPRYRPYFATSEIQLGT